MEADYRSIWRLSSSRTSNPNQLSYALSTLPLSLSAGKSPVSSSLPTSTSPCSIGAGRTRSDDDWKLSNCQKLPYGQPFRLQRHRHNSLCGVVRRSDDGRVAQSGRKRNDRKKARIIEKKISASPRSNNGTITPAWRRNIHVLENQGFWKVSNHGQLFSSLCFIITFFVISFMPASRLIVVEAACMRGGSSQAGTEVNNSTLPSHRRPPAFSFAPLLSTVSQHTNVHTQLQSMSAFPRPPILHPTNAESRLLSSSHSILSSEAESSSVSPSSFRAIDPRTPILTSSPSPSFPISLSSPAKVNLFLQILGQGKDGYHELSSLFHAIGLDDTLEVDVLPASSSVDSVLNSHTDSSNKSLKKGVGDSGDVLMCDDHSIPCDSNNLVLKAVSLLKRRLSEIFPSSSSKIFSTHFVFRLKKRVPSQAGLGGGSSNAAAAMVAANEILGNLATSTQLQQWISELGADCAFFLSSGIAHCTGRGDKIRQLDGPLPLLSNRHITIVKPPYGLSTPLVYRKLAQQRADANALEAESQATSLQSPLLTTPPSHNDILPLYFSSQLPNDENQRVEEIVESKGDEVRQEHLGSPSPFVNDLEAPAFSLKSDLVSLKKNLAECGFSNVMMSGSGTAIWCLDTPTEDVAWRRLVRRLEASGHSIVPTSFLFRSVKSAEKGGINEWFKRKAN